MSSTDRFRSYVWRLFIRKCILNAGNFLISKQIDKNFIHPTTFFFQLLCVNIQFSFSSCVQHFFYKADNFENEFHKKKKSHAIQANLMHVSFRLLRTITFNFVEFELFLVFTKQGEIKFVLCSYRYLTIKKVLNFQQNTLYFLGLWFIMII